MDAGELERRRGRSFVVDDGAAEASDHVSGLLKLLRVLKTLAVPVLLYDSRPLSQDG